MEETYIFREDWFTRNIPIWEKYLSSYKGKADIQFLEIGSFEGRSAVWLLENVLTHETARLTCIDPFIEKPFFRDIPLYKDGEEHFRHNIQLSGVSHKVLLKKGFSQDLLPLEKPYSFDCIYVDGAHYKKAVLEDTVLSFLLLKQGGILILDDYLWKFNKDRPKPAIDVFLKMYEGYYELLHKDHQVILKKIKD